jgi:cell wall-associated NlpC family hydrolase
MKYEHLLGIPFKHGVDDCYTLLQRFYADNFGVTLSEYARPSKWWDQGMDLYMANAYEEGFRGVDCHPSKWQPGDVFLIAVGARVACHAAINLGDGTILHHYTDRLSERITYGGIWRNMTLGVFRHKDVKPKAADMKQMDLMDLLPANKRGR